MKKKTYVQFTENVDLKMCYILNDWKLYLHFMNLILMSIFNWPRESNFLRECVIMCIILYSAILFLLSYIYYHIALHITYMNSYFNALCIILLKINTYKSFLSSLYIAHSWQLLTYYSSSIITVYNFIFINYNWIKY